MTSGSAAMSAASKEASRPANEISFANGTGIIKLSSWGIHGMNKAGFSVQEILGCGSRSVVRRGSRRSDGREFAIKCTASKEPEVRARVRNEFHMLRSLRHESIVAVEVLYESRFDLWLCMELCGQGSVDKYVKKRGPFPEAKVQVFALQVLKGLDYLHTKRIVHGDMSAQHLFLHNDASRVKIGGLKNCATVLGDAKSIFTPETGASHTYTAPEQKFSKLWSEFMDIWAFGMCIYFMLRGKVPFDVQSPDVAKTLLLDKLPDVSWDGMSDHMRDFTQKCLLVSMQTRPTAGNLLLHPLLGTHPVPHCDKAGNSDGSESVPTTEIFPSWSCSLLLPSCGILQLQSRLCIHAGKTRSIAGKAHRGSQKD